MNRAGAAPLRLQSLLAVGSRAPPWQQVLVYQCDKVIQGERIVAAFSPPRWRGSSSAAQVNLLTPGPKQSSLLRSSQWLGSPGRLHRLLLLLCDELAMNWVEQMNGSRKGLDPGQAWVQIPA